ncbi:hypothetical protein AB0756_35145 [Tolypothrix campylonemoides VB511288_2]|uniref:Uncharacterized protein n=2 Tax=Nostocales TaxID=1161 RepID=A0ABW8WZN2_9CYAN|nr:hypothetical protein [Tolypothrix bouteillei]
MNDYLSQDSAFIACLLTESFAFHGKLTTLKSSLILVGYRQRLQPVTDDQRSSIFSHAYWELTKTVTECDR